MKILVLDVLVLPVLALIWSGASKTMAEDTLAADTDSTMAALCRSYNLTFDDTPGVSPLESRGLILPVDYYQSVGIESLTCIRQGKEQETSKCRLLDTAQPVGNWDVAPCDCAPGTCRPVNHCGDPDLNSTTLGNVLIIEERSATEAVRFPPDDDSSGGTILVNFGVPTTVLSIGFMDIEETNPAVMEFRHTTGRTELIGPVTGDSGHVLHPIYLDQVTSMTITLHGSGAITSLRYTQGCVCDSGGDPHFTRFNQRRRDSFHGECDLVLMQTTTSETRNTVGAFAFHVRTTIQDYFSYISAAAVQVGGFVVQVDADKPDGVLLDGVSYSMLAHGDGSTRTEVASPSLDNSLSSQVLVSPSLVFANGNQTYSFHREHHLCNAKKRSYRLELTPWSYLRFKMYDKYLTVSIHAGGNSRSDFAGVVGLLGRYPDGRSVTRDGPSIDIDPTMTSVMYGTFADFAMEWQVDPTRGDPLLFDVARPPQLPHERCRWPTAARPSRRQLWLRGSSTSGGVTVDRALQACKAHGVPMSNLDLCVDDILATGDTGLAAIW